MKPWLLAGGVSVPHPKGTQDKKCKSQLLSHSLLPHFSCSSDITPPELHSSEVSPQVQLVWNAGQKERNQKGCLPPAAFQAPFWTSVSDSSDANGMPYRVIASFLILTEGTPESGNI